MPRYLVKEVRRVEVEAPDEDAALDAADETDWEQTSQVTVTNVSDMGEEQLVRAWSR